MVLLKVAINAYFYFYLLLLLYQLSIDRLKGDCTFGGVPFIEGMYCGDFCPFLSTKIVVSKLELVFLDVPLLCDTCPAGVNFSPGDVGVPCIEGDLGDVMNGNVADDDDEDMKVACVGIVD